MDDYSRQGQTAVNDPDNALPRHNIVDMVTFGRHLRALRILRGFDRATDFTTLLIQNYGVDVSDRTLYAIERGEQMPHIDFYFAAICALGAERDYFSPAVRPDVVRKLARRKGRK